MTSKRAVLLLVLLTGLFVSSGCEAEPNGAITVEKRDDGWRLMVDGAPFMVNGMNWDSYPIGTNYEYVLWNQPDTLIRAVLDQQMGLLQAAGVNAIRVYTGIQPKWITYIYETYGIHTMLNHSFGRYGLMLDGSWVANTDYGDPRVADILLKEVSDLVREFEGTPGLLLYLLGNENNYGLFWSGAETEDIPMADRASTKRARDMYKLFNRGALAMKAVGVNRPIAIANGDDMFLDIIAEELPDIDIFGTNTYRGLTFTDLYDNLKAGYDKPVLLTEFGADAFNSKTGQEDQACQARYVVDNWMDVYSHAAGMGRAGNSIGGFTFQFSDGWWKTGQTVDLDVHNTTASWVNGGYRCDYETGKNNMNEEWFGVMAKGAMTPAGTYVLTPRLAYTALIDIHRFDPYAPGATIDSLRRHFERIPVETAR
jgi:hypothetical protein